MDLDGLEVRCRGVSIRRYYQIADMTLGTREDGTKFEDKISHREALARVWVTELLVGWNLEDENGPVPATVDGFLDQEDYFATVLYAAWFEAVGSIPAPLERRSSAGEPLEVPSMPMESLSGSLENSLMPN